MVCSGCESDAQQGEKSMQQSIWVAVFQAHAFLPLDPVSMLLVTTSFPYHQILLSIYAPANALAASIGIQMEVDIWGAEKEMSDPVFRGLLSIVSVNVFFDCDENVRQKFYVLNSDLFT